MRRLPASRGVCAAFLVGMAMGGWVSCTGTIGLTPSFGDGPKEPAEGGTGADHSVVAFRSKNIFGPYTSYEKNPILTQRHLKGRQHPITSTGHADLVELPDGRWYTIFLGTRPYEGDYYNTGRETFLTPVVWENEWPLINPGLEEVGYRYAVPFPAKKAVTGKNKYSGNFSYKDDFIGTSLSKDWIFLRTLKSSWFGLSGNKGLLKVNLRPETVAGKANPSYIARRQQHTNFAATTYLLFSPQAENEKAGLLCFMNEDHFYYLAISQAGNQPVVQLFQSSANKADTLNMALLASKDIDGGKAFVRLKVEAKGDKYAFYFSLNETDWVLLKDDVDGKFLSTKTAGGFVGVTVGLYATSLGKNSSNTAYFDWFEYTGNDPVHASPAKNN